MTAPLVEAPTEPDGYYLVRLDPLLDDLMIYVLGHEMAGNRDHSEHYLACARLHAALTRARLEVIEKGWPQ